MNNQFCKYRDLSNEADVEALFVDRLLRHLNYPDDKVLRKKSLSEIIIGKGSKKERYKPDYVLLDAVGDPIIVIDAKSPKVTLEDYHYQVSSYALHLNQGFKDKNPLIYCILTNGAFLTVYSWDNSQPIFHLKFDDFVPHNEKYLELRSNISYSAFKQTLATKDVFEFRRPTLSTLLKTFNECHNIIWKKEKISPTDAFYEFAKLMFIKIKEDNKIYEIINNNERPKLDNFLFTTQWIDNQSKFMTNPIDEILFNQLQKELEQQIKNNKKKRVFEKGEGLNLKASTIYEVIKRLEHFDLYGIDEDLNGRMFETFLNATVRGKGLGQFFTPRGVVHYMVETTPLKISTNPNLPKEQRIPLVFDGCCGSGGFLIDAMATLTKEINNKTNLSDQEKQAYLEQVKNHHLYGIEANPKMSRIARLNMYLHGDGGSKIFKADALDKKIESEAGISQEDEEGLKELREEFINKKIKFDVILSNPPFSMKYDSKDQLEKQILLQYNKIVYNGTKRSTKEKSNVLFLERYFDLLKEETGELATVIDDTVLNGQKSQRYRDFFFNNFIIKQIISLPFNTFFGAQANIKTSIIHLRKKRKDEKQGHIFMAIANNIGHDDHVKPTPDRNNLPEIAKYYDKWLNGEHFDDIIIQNQSNDEPLGCPLQIFTVSPQELNLQRLDAFYYAPELKNARKKLIQLEKKGKIKLLKGEDFNKIPVIKKGDEKKLVGNYYKYFEINDVTIDGTIVKHRYELFQNLPTRARLQVNTGDVVFAKNNSSRGTTVIIPKNFNNQLVTTGFIGLRPESEDEKWLLWGILESDFFRMQVYYLAITASQPEIRDHIFNEEVLVPIPIDNKIKADIIKNAKAADRARSQLENAISNSSSTINELLG